MDSSDYIEEIGKLEEILGVTIAPLHLREDVAKVLDLVYERGQVAGESGGYEAAYDDGYDSGYERGQEECDG